MAASHRPFDEAIRMVLGSNGGVEGHEDRVPDLKSGGASRVVATASNPTSTSALDNFIQYSLNII